MAVVPPAYLVPQVTCEELVVRGRSARAYVGTFGQIHATVNARSGEENPLFAFGMHCYVPTERQVIEK